ncbi:hypothetical protein BH18VER2_BH18VER2_17170 [soil metagenome]
MKEKLTLTIDRAVIARAKAFAKRERTSLSQIVEAQFKRLGTESFVEKWGGKFKEPPADPSDPRLTYLRKKYLGAKE